MIVELAGLHRQFEQEDRTDHDPGDRPQAEGESVGERRGRLRRRHAIDDDRDCGGEDGRPGAGDVPLEIEHRQRHEEKRHRQQGDQGRPPQRSRRIVDLRPDLQFASPRWNSGLSAVQGFRESVNSSIPLLARNSGRKTAALVSWNCSGACCRKVEPAFRKLACVKMGVEQDAGAIQAHPARNALSAGSARRPPFRISPKASAGAKPDGSPPAPGTPRTFAVRSPAKPLPPVQGAIAMRQWCWRSRYWRSLCWRSRRESNPRPSV